MALLTILNVIGFTLDVVGKIIVGYTAIAVHHRFHREHCVDEKVFQEMKREQKYALLGIGMIIIGYALQLPHKLIS